MKIQIIGSGSMWNSYNSACYLVDDLIMVDFPNGACKYLYRENIKPSSIEYILLTHFHGDHYFDIPFFVLNKSKSDNRNALIYCDKEGIDKITNLGELAFPNSYSSAIEETNINFKTDLEFRIKDYNISKIEVDHGRMKPAYGYIFESNNLKVGFTGDSYLSKNIEVMASMCDYLISDCMLIEGTDKHMGIDNMEYLISKYPNCKIIVTHLELETRSLLKEKNLKNIIIPNDGDIFEL